jgi:hypothetical protein
MWTAAEGLASRDRGGNGGSLVAGMASAWAAPELIWNRDNAAVFMPITCPAGLTSGPPEPPD